MEDALRSQNKYKVFYIINIILIFLTVIFIWGNSLLDKSQSHEVSSKVLVIVKPVLEAVVGVGNVTDFLVRKLGHFTEFFILGCELTVFLILRRRVNLQPLVNIFFFGFFIATIDETIQIFTGRGSQLQDVWIDIAGTTTGIIIVLFILYIVIAIHKRRKKATVFTDSAKNH